MNRKKSVRSDIFVIKTLAVVYHIGIDMIDDVITEIYNDGDIPEIQTRSIFLALPKYPGAS